MLSTSDLAVAPLSERTDDWLLQELRSLWQSFFWDIPQANQVDISFARAWKTRLGLIRLSETGGHTYIGLNLLLRESQVPEQVITVTIAHEIVHYAHGFGSPLPRKHRHPHNGDIVTRELVSRGLASQLRVFKEWTSTQWYSFYYTNFPHRRNGHNNNGHHGI